MGVMSEAATGTAEAKSASGCGKDSPNTTMLTPVFCTPVSMAIAIISSSGLRNMKEVAYPIIIPTQTLAAVASKILQFITLNMYRFV